jgi:hypothetical protein
MTATSSSTRLVVPELGPSLGRLVAPPPLPAGAVTHWIALEDLRLALVNQLFELAGDARQWAREGDRELALATLNREAWLKAWQSTVGAVADRAAGAISTRLLAAAAEARLPPRKASALALDPDEVAALAARIDAEAAGLESALFHVDQAAHAARSGRASAGAVAEWQRAICAAARRMEAAWLAMEEALGREWQEWAVEVEEIRAWRRPLWPLVLSGGVLFLVAGYVGLVLGGYLPVPGLLRGVAEAIWARWS